MNSRLKWLGPGALVGGLGAAMLCGAGSAAADSGANAGAVGHAVHAGAPAPAAARAAQARPVRAAVRPAAPKPAAARVSKPQPAAAAAPKVVSAAATAAAPKVVSAAATAAPRTVEPSSVPIDPAQYAGTYYEQGSVKQFFAIGLVNTKAVYSVKPDGSLRVQNSGNYFFNRGPKSSIVGAAVPVNSTNTALNVGFGRTPSANPPGNYLIIDRAPDYSWAIVSDPSGRSGYVLTRDKNIDPQTYAQLVARAQALGVTGRITPTTQFPA